MLTHELKTHQAFRDTLLERASVLICTSWCEASHWKGNQYAHPNATAELKQGMHADALHSPRTNCEYIVSPSAARRRT